MHTSIAILSALAASAAAYTARTTVDVTIISCPPEVTSCPGQHPPAGPQSQTVYNPVDTVASCGPDVSSCPGTPATTYPAGTESGPASGTEGPSSPSADNSAPYTSSVPALTPSSDTYPPTLPSSSSADSISYSSVTSAVEAGYSSAPSGPGSGVAPYPITPVVTMAISSNAPIGTGTGVVPPNYNATSTYPPVASYTGAAGSISCSIGVVAGLAAIAALVMA